MLRTMAVGKPDDPFLQYGLAMELKKQGNVDEARRTFDGLVEHHPGYVATYLMYGNLLVELGERDAAASIFDRGIEAAGAQGNAHAKSELETARAELS